MKGSNVSKTVLSGALSNPVSTDVLQSFQQAFTSLKPWLALNRRIGRGCRDYPQGSVFDAAFFLVRVFRIVEGA